MPPARGFQHVPIARDLWSATMKPMRAYARAFLLLALLAPIFALANTSPTADPKIETPDPFVGSEDPCISGNSVMKNGKLVTTETQGENYDACEEKKCTKDTKAPACIDLCGTLTIVNMANKSCEPISKCSPEDEIAKKVSECTTGVSPGDLSDHTLTSINGKAVKKIDTSTDAGRQQLADIFKGNDASPGTVASIKDDPNTAENAQKYLLCQINKDCEADDVKALADKLALNEDVKTNISQLKPSEFAAALDDAGALTPQQQATIKELDAREQTTGFDPQQVSTDPDTDPQMQPAVPLPQQSANEQIRSTAQAVCQTYGIQDCKQFENGMIATFYQECGGRANCMGHGRSYAGSFALSQDEYSNGIQAFAQNCDSSSSVFNYVQQSCNGDGRGDHLCNTAAAVANHARVEPGIQAATSDPRQQAAMHMMYQLMPTQTVRALTSGDPSSIFGMQLNGPALSALCSNKVCLNSGAVWADAVNAILGQYGTLRRGVAVATGIADPGLGGLLVAQGSVFPGSDILARNGMSPFGSLFSYSDNSSNTQSFSAGSVYNGDTYCITSLQPQVVYTIPAGTPFPSNCYNSSARVASVAPNPAPATPARPAQASPQQPAQQPVSQQILPGQTPGQGATPIAQTPSPKVLPVASIIVQPRQVARGNPFIVSRSSVGMNASAPCQVFVFTGSGTSTIAQGNEGSQKVPTDTASPPALWTFSVQCTSALGDIVLQQATSVSVK